MLQREHLQLQDAVGTRVLGLLQLGAVHVVHGPAPGGVDHESPLEQDEALDLSLDAVLLDPRLLTPVGTDVRLGLLEWVLDLDKLADEGVEEDNLVVVGVGRREFVILAQLELHHEPLEGGVDLPGEVARHHVEGDELVADTDDVPVVAGHLDAENSELVTLHGVFQGAA